MEDYLPFHSWNLPFHSILASSKIHTEISAPFHSIFHSIPCPCWRFYIIIIIVTLYPNGRCQFENPEAPDFKQIATASSSFSTLSLPSSLSLPIFFNKVLPLPQKINHFRFQLPLPHPWFTITNMFLRSCYQMPCWTTFVSDVQVTWLWVFFVQDIRLYVKRCPPLNVKITGNLVGFGYGWRVWFPCLICFGLKPVYFWKKSLTISPITEL